jgi:GT2 family glycosyltransferase
VLTVLLTTRDGGDGLRETLDALGRLVPPAGGWRLVLADDGSTDGTSVLLAEVVRRGGRDLRVIRTPGVGLSAARNLALSEVAGDLVVFTDDDTIPRPDWLVRIRAAADAHPEADVVAGSVFPRFETPPAPHVLRAVRKGPAFVWVERAESGWVDPTEAVGPSFAVRAARLAAGLRFDPTIGPDGTDDYAMGSETELLLRLRATGARCWFAADAVVEHQISAAQTTPESLVRRAWRYGRGRWRLRTSRLARAGGRVGGVPAAILADLLLRRIAHAVARLRRDEAARLRAAWRIAYLAGHVAEIRRARGRPATLGPWRALIPAAVRGVVAAPPRPARRPRSGGGETVPVPAFAAADRSRT